MTHMRHLGPPSPRTRPVVGRLLAFALLAMVALGGAAAAAGAAVSHAGPGVSAPPPGLTVPTPTTNTSVLDLGMALNVSVDAANITGGSGNVSNFNFTWLGLPTNCTSANVSSYTCYPTASGTFSISVHVNDTGNRRSGSSASVTITVNTDPTITAFTVSASSVQVNTTIVFRTSATGGTAPLTYVYSGLPTGCSGNDTAVVTCTPTVAQSHNVTVYVVDAVGMASNTPYTVVTVNAPPAPAPVTHPTPLEWAVIAVILLIGFAISALLFVRARRMERASYRAAPKPYSQPPSTGPGPSPPPGPGEGTSPPGKPPS